MTATDDAATRVLLAILDGATYRGDIINRTGLTPAIVHARCHALRDAGLIDWVDGCAGTMRALVTPVTMPPRPRGNSQVPQIAGQTWENRSAPRGAGNTGEGLTTQDLYGRP